jgi:hypothetical protein
MNSAQEAYENWFAICNHMPGREPAIRVGGTVICPTTGWSVQLKQTEGNTGINPLMLHLDLIVTPPPPGTPVQEVLTPEEVEWREAPPALEYEEVEFRRSDSDPPPIMKVDHPT